MARIEKYTEKQYTWGDDRPTPGPGEFQVVVADDGEPQSVEFLCPCGCGNPVYLPLVTSLNERKSGGGPRWDWKTGGHLVHPSVLWTSGCRSHFFVNLDGSIAWC